MRKFILMILVILAVQPAQAQSVFGGGALSVGIRENVRHAGVDNWSMSLYYTPDGAPPARDREPAYFLESNVLEPAVANKTPGDTQGKWWAVVQVKPVNAGEINAIKTECEAVELPFSSEMGGYLIDLSQMPAGKYFIGTSVSHEGGEVTYQVLIFLFRSKKEVTDQAGFWLGVYNPEREYYPQEIAMSGYARGFEPSNGAKAYALAMDKPAPVRMIQPVNAGADQSLTSTGLIQLIVFANKGRTKPASGSFRLVSEDGTFQSEPQSGSRIEFLVPRDKRYRIQTTESGRWKIFNCPDFVSVDTEVIIEGRR